MRVVAIADDRSAAEIAADERCIERRVLATWGFALGVPATTLGAVVYAYGARSAVVAAAVGVGAALGVYFMYEMGR